MPEGVLGRGTVPGAALSLFAQKSRKDLELEGGGPSGSAHH